MLVPQLDPEAVRAALADAISAALPGEMVTRWVAVVETIDEQGERALWHMSPTGQKVWDTLGMVRHVELVETATRIRDYIDDDDS